MALKDSSGKQLFMPGYWSGQSRSFDIPFSDKKPPPDKPSHTSLKASRGVEKHKKSPTIVLKKNPESCSLPSSNETSAFCSTKH